MIGLCIRFSERTMNLPLTLQPAWIQNDTTRQRRSTDAAHLAPSVPSRIANRSRTGLSLTCAATWLQYDCNMIATWLHHEPICILYAPQPFDRSWPDHDWYAYEPHTIHIRSAYDLHAQHIRTTMLQSWYTIDTRMIYVWSSYDPTCAVPRSATTCYHYRSTIVSTGDNMW